MRIGLPLLLLAGAALSTVVEPLGFLPKKEEAGPQPAATPDCPRACHLAVAHRLRGQSFACDGCWTAAKPAGCCGTCGGTHEYGAGDRECAPCAEIDGPTGADATAERPPSATFGDVKGTAWNICDDDPCIALIGLTMWPRPLCMGDTWPRPPW